MVWQIFSKEFLKLNKALFALLFIHIGLVVYFWLRIRNNFISSDAIDVWTGVVGRHSIFFSMFNRPICVSALVLGVLQFYPEVDQRRFRISCHLPINERMMTAGMILFSAVIITICWLIDLAGVLFVSVKYFPREIYSEIPLIMFYWYIRASLFYAVASVITLEPSWKQKIRLFIMLAAFYKLIAISIYNTPNIYIIHLLILSALFLMTIYYPAERFKQGVE
jgi:hypothetical protein